MFGNDRNVLFEEPYGRPDMGPMGFGMDYRLHESSYHIPRTHTYPLGGTPYPQMGLPYHDQHKMFYSSPDLHREPVVPGQTRIQLGPVGTYTEDDYALEDPYGGFASGADASIPT